MGLYKAGQRVWTEQCVDKIHCIMASYLGGSSGKQAFRGVPRVPRCLFGRPICRHMSMISGPETPIFAIRSRLMLIKTCLMGPAPGAAGNGVR